MKLSILIPVYNEASTIQQIVNKIILTSFDAEIEIIIVNDASTDRTKEILNNIKDERIRVIHHIKNRGKGASIRTALAKATGDYIIIQDADFEYNPEDINKLISKAKEGYEVVYGSRFYFGKPPQEKMIHYLGNKFLTYLSNLFSGIHLTDMETCYKMIKKEIFDKISLEEDRFGIEPELTAKLAKNGYNIVEVPISYKGRTYKEGKKIGAKDAIRAIYCIVKYNLNK